MQATRSSVLLEAQVFAEDILTSQMPDTIRFHTIYHTYDVVNAALEIASHSCLNRDEQEIVELAAWFHDLGYRDVVKDHEKVSVNLALDFLSERKYDNAKTAQVAGCIMATQIPQSPKNLLEAILCDADMMHLAKKDYLQKSWLLHQEREQQKELVIAYTDWLRQSRDFISRHHFFTDYARSKYGRSKAHNLKTLADELQKASRHGSE